MARSLRSTITTVDGFRRIKPYWHNYIGFAKHQWFGRTILDVLTAEFKYRTPEYYRYALETGMITVNGKVVEHAYIMANDDRIDQVFHYHEPPVTAKRIKTLHHDTKNGLLVIEKPAGIPTHRTGRFQRNSVIEILKNEYGYRKLYGIHRIDMAVSGVMLLPLTLELSHALAKEFASGTVTKEYVARCMGKFPDNEVFCDAPLLHIDSRIGLHMVHPEGKPAQTKFIRLRYDPDTDTSVVLCKPQTGRGHQIRVHLHYLGHPIANDPVYNEDAKHFHEEITKLMSTNKHSEAGAAKPASLATSAPLDLTVPSHSAIEATDAIGAQSSQNLASTDVEANPGSTEDWSRWRDVVFLTRKRLGVAHPEQPASYQPPYTLLNSAPPQLTPEEALAEIARYDREEAKFHIGVYSGTNDPRYCNECCGSLPPEPKAEEMFMFLHAIKYGTSLGTFESEMPEWAKKDWKWERA